LLIKAQCAPNCCHKLLNQLSDFSINCLSTVLGNGQSSFGRSQGGFGGSRGGFGGEGTLEMEIANRDVARVIGLYTYC